MRSALVAFVAATLTSAALAGQWTYQQDEDKMDGSITKLATIESDNSMSLASPYAGDNHGRLIIRSRKSDGLNVIFLIRQGQLICGYSDCYVMVRFDSAQPIRFAATKPADGSSNGLFLSNERRFVEVAKGAKQIRVAATVYQSGTQVLEFSSSTPLVWDVPKVAPKAPPPAQPNLNGLSRQEQMKACNTGAGDLRGDDRKQYMTQCLR